MQFIPGSHRLRLAPYHPHQDLHLVIDDQALAPHLAAAVDVEFDPGDVVLFHNLLYHRGLPNRAGTVRWSVDWRFQDATQPTLRPQAGHLVRSAAHPQATIVDRAAWAAASFG